MFEYSIEYLVYDSILIQVFYHIVADNWPIHLMAKRLVDRYCCVWWLVLIAFITISGGYDYICGPSRWNIKSRYRLYGKCDSSWCSFLLIQFMFWIEFFSIFVTFSTTYSTPFHNITYNPHLLTSLKPQKIQLCSCQFNTPDKPLSTTLLPFPFHQSFQINTSIFNHLKVT